MNCEQCGKLWAYTNSQRIELPLTHISIGNKKVVALIRPPFFGIDPNATAPACWTKNELKRKVTSLRKFFFRIRILNGGWTRGQCAFRRPVLLAYGYDVRNSKNEERSSMTFYCHNVSGQFLTGQSSWIKTLSTWNNVFSMSLQQAWYTKFSKWKKATLFSILYLQEHNYYEASPNRKPAKAVGKV